MLLADVEKVVTILDIKTESVLVSISHQNLMITDAYAVCASLSAPSSFIAACLRSSQLRSSQVGYSSWEGRFYSNSLTRSLSCL